MSQQTLLSVQPEEQRAYARRSHPWTSHAAALEQSDSHLTEIQERVKACLMGGPYTAEEVVDRYRKYFGDDVTDSSIRSRLNELVTRKKIARISDEKGLSRRGKACQKWELR